MELVAPACNIFLRCLLLAFADCHVYGREHVPSQGPFILVSNHQGSIDAPLLNANIHRSVRFLAKDTLFANLLMTSFLRGYGAYPVRRDGRDLAASRWALRQIQAGYPLVVFPEGTRSPGQMKKAHHGVAYLAVLAGVPILPVGITGTERLGPYWRVVFPTGRITVTFGEPFSIPAPDGRPDRVWLIGQTEQIMRRVAALLPQGYRGVYGENTAPFQP